MLTTITINVYENKTAFESNAESAISCSIWGYKIKGALGVYWKDSPRQLNKTTYSGGWNQLYENDNRSGYVESASSNLNISCEF